MSTLLDTGRDAFRRHRWRAAYEDLARAESEGEAGFGLDDLESIATAAYLVGSEDSADRWARAHQGSLQAGLPARAARCAFWLAYGLMTAGEVGRGGGWLGRANELVEELDRECVERGYLLMPSAIACCEEVPAQALQLFASAGEIADQFHDADLAAMARMGQGQALVAMGLCEEARAELDMAMVAVTAGEVSPIAAGIVLCGAIDACHAGLDLGRATEWTVALSNWCDSQPDLAPFRGQCLVHRTEVMQLHGDWDDADTEARQAWEALSGVPAGGEALYRQAELHRLRGELQDAEELYHAAVRAGHPAQPGLALLRLAQGRIHDAVAAMRRLLVETEGTARRARVLGPFVEVMIESGDIDAASEAAAELIAISEAVGTRYCDALSAHAYGAVRVAAGEPQAALAALRRAWASWRGLDAPYEAARTRVLIAVACREVGDHDTAAMELDAARGVFEALRATGDLARVERLEPSRPSPALGGLTQREVEVLVLVARGATNREIAASLVISEHTVARHIQNIFAKVGASSRTAAAAFAYRSGLL